MTPLYETWCATTYLTGVRNLQKRKLHRRTKETLRNALQHTTIYCNILPYRDSLSIDGTREENNVADSGFKIKLECLQLMFNGLDVSDFTQDFPPF